LALGGIELQLNYNSSPLLATQLNKFAAHAAPYWRLNIARQLYRNSDGTSISAVRGDGSVLNFRKDGAGYVGSPDASERLVADGANLLLFSDKEGLVEKYGGADYKLLSISAASGRTIQFAYSDGGTPSETASKPGVLITLSDDRGTSLQLGRESGSDRLIFLRQSGGPATVDLAYDNAGRLSTVSFADGTYKALEYGDAAHPTALTGLRHEGGLGRSVYGYDAYGRATTTGVEGFAGVAIGFSGTPSVSTTESYNPYTRVLTRRHEWSVPLSVSVTRPNGAVSDQTFASVYGFPRLKRSTQPAGSGCSAATKTQERDAYGNVIQRDDFNGNRSCHGFDIARKLETSRVEGLGSTAACTAVLPAGSTLPAGSRKTTTQWHPTWRLETKRAEPRRLTTRVYNGQPDPFKGGATAWCAPTGATLPDGSPVAVLCKQVEQATTDANGASGVSATVDSAVPSRIQHWTYNATGQVLTATDPLGNSTSYAYYSDTTADHTKGDLETVTNAKGHVTRFTKYNAAGRWLEMKDGNNVLTTRTFDLRERLKSVTVGGGTTSYDYWPTGLLKKVILPDNSSLSYGYDGAQRLTSITDQLGNSITYTLDNAGNRTAEAAKDPNGVLARSLSRIPDALNRIQQVTGRE